MGDYLGRYIGGAPKQGAQPDEAATMSLCCIPWVAGDAQEYSPVPTYR